MIWTTERLYQLLPAIYRLRDAEAGEPLKALIAVIADQAGVMEADITQLYENLFIETCEEWVVPYLGDLLGVRGLHTVSGEANFSQRARVANTLSYRRRKGTATMLEQLARDTTGWNARAVEFFKLLATTQNVNHLRLDNHRTPDLRRTNELELLNTAFDTTAQTADVRHIASNRGRHNIPNIGLFLWRLPSYFIEGVSAHQMGEGRFTFNPLGIAAPLFNRPQTETTITHLAEEINVPGLLRRRPLYDELEARRQAIADGEAPRPVYFGEQPVCQVFVQQKSGDPFVEVKPEKMLICNLSDLIPPVPEIWPRPPVNKSYRPSAGGVLKPMPITAAIDPLLGRIAFGADAKPNAVKVSYAYGFSGDVGGGPYSRRASVEAVLTEMEKSPDKIWHVGVSKDVKPVQAERIFTTLTEALQEWNKQVAGSDGIITMLDNATYEENLGPIEIPEGHLLMIVAADWPATPVPGDKTGQKQRIRRKLEPNERRAHIKGDITITAKANNSKPGKLVIDGLLIEGKLTVSEGNLGNLRLAHTTLVPGNGGLIVESQLEQVKIELERSICGPIEIKAAVSRLDIRESIVDRAEQDTAIKAGSTDIDVQRSTILGKLTARSIEAGNSIFTDIVKVERKQTGCVRFSYVPPGSTTPRRFRCQPDLAVEGVPETEAANIKARLVPAFTSEHYINEKPRYVHFGYGQVGPNCAAELRTGAEDGAEMGVFNFLKQPQRDANLRASLDEYLRFGLEAGLIHVDPMLDLSGSTIL